MGKTYDAESLLLDVQTLLLAKLNNKLAAISAEKADSVQLKSIDSGAYFLQTLDERVANYDPFLVFGVTGGGNDVGVGPAVAEDFVAQVVVVLSETGQDESSGKRLLRYRRALKEVFCEDWATIRQGTKISVKSLNPVSIELDGARFRAVGIEIETALV